MPFVVQVWEAKFALKFQIVSQNTVTQEWASKILIFPPHLYIVCASLFLFQKYQIIEELVHILF